MALLRILDRLFRHEATGGVLLVLSALLALVAANSGLRDIYAETLSTRVAITIGGTGLDKPLILWINDALMAFSSGLS